MRYFEPETVDEALGLLAEHGDGAKVIAGGQSLLILMRERLVDVDALVGLKAIEPLRAIETNGEARIGAMVDALAGRARPADRRGLAAAARGRGRGVDAAGAQPRDAVRQRRPRVPDRRPAGARSSPPTPSCISRAARRRADGRGGGLLRRADADRGRPGGARYRDQPARAARRGADGVCQVRDPPARLRDRQRRGAGRGGRGRDDLGRAHRPRRRREPHAPGHRGRARARRRARRRRSCSRAPAQAAARQAEPLADVDGTVDYKRRVAGVYTARALAQALG